MDRRTRRQGPPSSSGVIVVGRCGTDLVGGGDGHRLDVGVDDTLRPADHHAAASGPCMLRRARRALRREPTPRRRGRSLLLLPARPTTASRTSDRAARGIRDRRTACGSPRSQPTSARSSGPAGRATSRTSSVSSRLVSTDDKLARSASPTLPRTSSTWSTRPASDPYSRIHLAAVFSPTPGMPGRLSDGRRATRRSRGIAAASARTWPPPLQGEAGQLGDAALRIEHGGAVVDELQRVPVTGDDEDAKPCSRACVVSVAMTSSAS